MPMMDIISLAIADEAAPAAIDVLGTTAGALDTAATLGSAADAASTAGIIPLLIL